MTTDLDVMYAWLDEESGHHGPAPHSGETPGLLVAVLSLNGRPAEVLRQGVKPPSKARRMRKRRRSRAKSRYMPRRRRLP